MTGEPAAWVRDPALRPLWRAARERLERNGLQPSGTITLTDLGRASRHAVSGLLGRPVVQASPRVDLADVDRALRERSGAGGLVAVLESLGEPLRNRAAERSARAAEREAPFDAARSWLSQHPDLSALPWVDQWLSELRRSGAAMRASDPLVLVRALDVVAAVWELPSAEPEGGRADGGWEGRPTARSELAARVTGDAHALDDGTTLANVVLRALSLHVRTDWPTTAADRRSLWERVGVSTDSVSSTCLAWGLSPVGGDGVSRRLALAAADGDPVHLTAWDLARTQLLVQPGSRVLVCENPRVLEAAATARVEGVAVVCTSGVPGLTALEVLDRLAACRAAMAYHGDFDWAGIAMANRLIDRVACRPWLMGCEDYLASVRADGPALIGSEVVARWDPHLAAAMREHGVAVHEEAQLPMLVDRLPELVSGA